MKKIHLTFPHSLIYGALTLCVVILPHGVWGQDACNVNQRLNRIEQFYTNGLFYRAVDSLKHLKIHCGEENSFVKKQEQYFDLLAKNFIALDSLAQADSAIQEILSSNPYFEPTAPPKYRQMVNDAKTRGLDFSISSVSKGLEDINKAPATVVVLDQKTIRRRGYIDLDQMFDDLPGFDVARTTGSTYSNIYQRGYRSNNTTRTIFMINGIEDNDFWSNISSWSRQIPISNISRVEILYGPAATMYGKNALVGVVNVITKKPIEHIKGTRHTGISVDGGTGSFNTKYGEATVVGKLKEKNVLLSVTGRFYQSDEMDLSRFPEYDYDPVFYENYNYKDLYTTSDSMLARYRRGDSLALADFTINATNDTLRLGPTGEQIARDADIAALNIPLQGQPVAYSNILEQYYVLGNLRVGDLSLGYQQWGSKQGTTNYGTDNGRAGAKNGSVWQNLQSTLFAHYETRVNRSLVIANTAQFRITEVDDTSSVVSLRNFSNKSLNLQNLYEGQLPRWQRESFFQRSKQFRNELKLVYTPFRSLKVITGAEYRFSANQGDYFRLIQNDSVPGSASEIGRSSLDNVPGGNHLDYRELGIYLQGTYQFFDKNKHSWFGLTLGGRYDNSRINQNEGLGTVFNPRTALVITPPSFFPNGGAISFKAIYASAFQDPSARDRYSIATSTRKVNNPNLGPETVQNVDLVFGYTQNRTIRFEATYFSSKYDGVVAQRAVSVCEISPGVYSTDCPAGAELIATSQNQNFGRINIHGLQTSAWLTFNDLELYANYTFTDPESTVGNGTRGRLVRVADIANHSVNAGVNLSLLEDKVNLNLRGNYVGPRPVGPNTTVPNNPQANGRFEPYILLNGAVTVSGLVPEFEGARLQLIVNNILNKEYFHPGIRGANGITQAYRTPQRSQNIMTRLIFDF